MTPDMTIQFLLDALLLIAMGACGFIVRLLWQKVDENTDVINSVNTRVVRIESFIEIVRQKVLDLLHDSDDHLGLDTLVQRYRDNHYDLSLHDWESLKSICELISKNESITKDERTLAALAIALAEHKQMLNLDEKTKKGIK